MSVDTVRRALLFAPVLFVLPRFASALEPTFAENDVAIRGFDPVAYFVLDDATEGDPSISAEYQGAVWHFVSAEHRDMFAADPGRYAPQYGGYCAWAASRNYVAPTDPEAWQIVDDKLYLNFSRLLHARWTLRARANIAKGDANWPGLLAAN